jgi:hypothetical protein
MQKKKSVFVYPITKEVLKRENNDYVRQLIRHLGGAYNISNHISSIGLVDAFLKFRNTDIYYFNWIEDVPTKRFGLLQVVLLAILLPLCKLSGKKVAWFIHNNVSHDKKRLAAKKIVVWLMSRYADLSLSHSNEVKLTSPAKRLQVFHHPVEKYHELAVVQPGKYDLLIWGKVSSYKGVAEFVKYASASQFLRNYKILLVGKFDSDEYYEEVIQAKSDNIIVLNQFVTDNLLRDYFSQSRYVLFTYISNSVLSSAALCKTLSFGKEIIGPNLGSFKELGNKGLIHTYDTHADLEVLLKNLHQGKKPKISESALHRYVLNNSWNHFSAFLIERINNLYAQVNPSIHKTINHKPIESEPT